MNAVQKCLPGRRAGKPVSVSVETQALPIPRPLPETRGRQDARPVPPVLEPRANGLAERFSRAFGPENPVRVFIVALLAGYALLVTAMVFLGFFLIYGLLPITGLEGPDEHFIQWLADNRSPTQEDLSWIGSTLAGGLVIPALLGIGLLTFLIMRRWLLAAFVVLVVALESGTYRVTSWIVERPRPNVQRLESLPVDASYPSGHTAAAVALYGGILLLVASRFQSTAVRVLTIILGVAIPLFVGWARMYRGMHHFSDVVAGLLMGLGALAILVFAARASRAASERRDGETIGREESA